MFLSNILKIFWQYQTNHLHLQGMVFGKCTDMYQYCCWPRHLSMEKTKLKCIISSSLYISASYVDNFNVKNYTRFVLILAWQIHLNVTTSYRFVLILAWLIHIFMNIQAIKSFWNFHTFFIHLWMNFCCISNPLWPNHNSLICIQNIREDIMLLKSVCITEHCTSIKKYMKKSSPKIIQSLKAINLHLFSCAPFSNVLQEVIQYITILFAFWLELGFHRPFHSLHWTNEKN